MTTHPPAGGSRAEGPMGLLGKYGPADWAADCRILGLAFDIAVNHGLEELKDAAERGLHYLKTHYPKERDDVRHGDDAGVAVRGGSGRPEPGATADGLGPDPAMAALFDTLPQLFPGTFSDEALERLLGDGMAVRP